MPTNPYLTQTGPRNEKHLINDLYSEIISMFGQDFYYIPRETLNKDDLYGEMVASRFDNAYPIEMMIENTDGFEGGEIFQKFGLEIRDEATVIVSQERFKQVLVNTPHRDMVRPREGDLVFVPFSNSLFEITFVEHESPFYLWNATPIYKFNMSLFESTGEDIDVDIVGLDKPAPDQTAGQGVEAENYLVQLTMAGAEDWTLGETVTSFANGVNVSGEVAKIDSEGAVIFITNLSHDDTTDDYQLFSIGATLTGSVSGASDTISAVTQVPQDFGNNDTIETIADDIQVFDQSNPFGEV